MLEACYPSLGDPGALRWRCDRQLPENSMKALTARDAFECSLTDGVEWRRASPTDQHRRHGVAAKDFTGMGEG